MCRYSRACVVDVGGRRLAVDVACGPVARARGVLGRGELRPGEGFLIPGCRSVHTVGMRRPIDVVFVSWPPSPVGAVRIVAIKTAVQPWRIVSVRARAAALEIRVGEAERLELAVGRSVRFVNLAR